MVTATRDLSDVVTIRLARSRARQLARSRPGVRGAPAGPANPPPIGGAIASRRSRPAFVGSPDTVARQIREFSEQTGVGHFDLIFNDLVMDFDLARRAVQLFGTEVMPQLKGVAVAN